MLGWDGFGGGFGVSKDVNDPVAIAVLEKLEAIDAPGKGGWFVGVMAGVVGAPDLDDIAKLLSLVVDRVFEEAVAGHTAAAPGDVAVDGEHDSVGVSILACGRRNEASIGNEERAHAVPVAWLAFGT